MKKLTKILMSALFAFTFVFASVMGITAATTEVKADETLAETAITNLQHRTGDNRLIIFLSDTDYASAGKPSHAPNDITAAGVTMLDNILLYLNDDTYVTLRTAWNNNGQVYYNVWGEMNSICLDTKSDYGLGKIKYLTVLDGCVLPSASTHAAGYVHKGNLTYQNDGYGTAGDCNSWKKTETAKTDG